MTESYDIVQIFAATKKLQEMNTAPKDSPANDRLYSSSISPIISINGINLDVPDVISFEMQMAAFVPTVKVTFKDTSGIFESDYLITNDSIISVFISPYVSQELLPIRCDFTVSSSEVTGKEYWGTNDIKIRKLTGQLRIPAFFKRTSRVSDDTSFNTLASAAKDYGLGFSSNVEDTDDRQIWVNSNSGCRMFIESIINHSYSDDNSFFTGFVDWFYDLNFVEVNRIFYNASRQSKGSGKTMKVYAVQLPTAKATEEDTAPYKDTEYALTNALSENVWNNYIETYSVIMRNQTTEGYRKYVQYYDYANDEFISEYVDPITAAGEGEIPVSKSRLDTGDADENLREENISLTDYGFITENVHKNYYFAETQNQFNMNMCKGFGIKVTLQAYNPYITMYSGVRVNIYDYNTGIATMKKAGDNEDLSPSMGEGDGRESGMDINMSVYNESLSGMYVVTGIRLIYNKQSGIMKEELTLNRREMKPPTRSLVRQ